MLENKFVQDDFEERFFEFEVCMSYVNFLRGKVEYLEDLKIKIDGLNSLDISSGSNLSQINNLELKQAIRLADETIDYIQRFSNNLNGQTENIRRELYDIRRDIPSYDCWKELDVLEAEEDYFYEEV